MICFEAAGTRFQLRAAAVVRLDGCILLHRLEGDAFWCLPGGRVEPGEDGLATVVREMKEEVGEAVRGGRLLFLVENFFRFNDQAQHELGLYYDITLAATSPLRDTSRPHWGIEGDRRLEFRWFPIARMAEVVFYPNCLISALALDADELRHFVEREEAPQT